MYMFVDFFVVVAENSTSVCANIFGWIDSDGYVYGIFKTTHCLRSEDRKYINLVLGHFSHLL